MVNYVKVKDQFDVLIEIESKFKELNTIQQFNLIKILMNHINLKYPTYSMKIKQY